MIWPNSTPVEGRRFPTSDLRWARSTDGGRTFGPAETVNADAGGVPASHTFHNALVDASGRLVVSWLDSRADWQRVADAAGWTPGDPAEGEPGEGPALYLTLRAILPGSIRDIVVARSDDGGATWGEPVRVHADDWVFDGCPHAGPGLDVGADGRVHVAWYTGQEASSGVSYASSTDRAATFSAPVPLTDGFAIPSQARVTPADDGALVAWELRGQGGARVRVARVSESGVGEAAEFEGELPEWAAAGDRTLLAWLDGESVRARWVDR